MTPLPDNQIRESLHETSVFTRRQVLLLTFNYRLSTLNSLLGLQYSGLELTNFSIEGRCLQCPD